MKQSTILLVTDRQDRSQCLIEAAQCIADCQVLAINQPWYLAAPVLGIIVDIRLEQPRTRSCLSWLAQQIGTHRPPAILVGCMPGVAAPAARPWGTAVSLATDAEPRTVVAALLRLLDPQASVADWIVRRGATRTANLLRTMFRSAEAGAVDLAAVEVGLEPVVNAIREGGLTHWLDIVWEHDDITFQHCLLVSGLVSTFAQSLGLSRADQLTMARAALVHDVGKARIPHAILNKPGRLDPDEMAVMRTHAALGYDILRASGTCDPIALAVTRHHHEMLDGSGYPNGLSSEAVSDPIRLLTVCDIYAALIERRSYKAPFSSDEAMRVLQSMVGKLDGALVQAFGTAVSSRNGYWSRLPPVSRTRDEGPGDSGSAKR